MNHTPWTTRLARQNVSSVLSYSSLVVQKSPHAAWRHDSNRDDSSDTTVWTVSQAAIICLKKDTKADLRSLGSMLTNTMTQMYMLHAVMRSVTRPTSLLHAVPTVSLVADVKNEAP